MADGPWKVCIFGEDNFLQDLAKVFDSDVCRITKGADGYILEGEIFTGCDSAENCRAAATTWLESLNGAAALVSGSDEPVDLSYVFYTASDGTQQSFAWLEDTATASDSCHISITRADGTVEEYSPTQSIPQILSASIADADIAKVLRLMGKREWNWAQFYRIYEIVRENAGGRDALVAAGWISKVAQTRFTRSANHPEIAGDLARHGFDSSEPPENPMSLGEAKALIDALVQQWLAR